MPCKQWRRESDFKVRAEYIVAVTIAAEIATIHYVAYKRFFVKDHQDKSMVKTFTSRKTAPRYYLLLTWRTWKGVYCRCWRSKGFPFGDGFHTKHNEGTGDNLGPLIIKGK
ncbi:unnamed protein product, partial [Gulo gulo]